MDFKSIMNEAENIRNTVCKWTYTISTYGWSSITGVLMVQDMIVKHAYVHGLCVFCAKYGTRS